MNTAIVWTLTASGDATDGADEAAMLDRLREVFVHPRSGTRHATVETEHSGGRIDLFAPPPPEDGPRR